MKTTTCLRYSMLVIPFTAFCWLLTSQPFARGPQRTFPSDTGKTLMMGDMWDFRLHLVNEYTTDDRERRGVVCVIRLPSSESVSCEEYSTNQFSTVAAALRTLGKLDRRTRKPQIRIVQRDCILQSTIGPSGSTASGYEPWFLERQLQAGDIIIFTLRSN